jgi:hypothetical protein
MIEAALPSASLIRRKAASGGRYDAQGPSGTRDGPVDDSVDCLFEVSGSACAQTVDEAVIYPVGWLCPSGAQAGFMMAS